METDRKYNFTKKIYNINEVLDNYSKKHSKKIFEGIEVTMSSQRLELFKEKGCTCVSCGRKGTYFRLQQNTTKKNSTKKYHFSLWSNDGIQLTKDHIIPKSKGGFNDLSNYQVMCESCNNEKSNSYTKEDIINGNCVNKNLLNPEGEENSETKPKDINKIIKNIQNKNYHWVKYRQDINKYMEENNYNPFDDYKNLNNLDKIIRNKVKYMFSYYIEIIKAYNGNITPKSKKLHGLPKKTTSYLISNFKNLNDFKF